MATYNPKDIYIQRATANQTWEESPVSVQPNSVLVTDDGLTEEESLLFYTFIQSMRQGIGGGYAV